MTDVSVAMDSKSNIVENASFFFWSKSQGMWKTHFLSIFHKTSTNTFLCFNLFSACIKHKVTNKQMRKKRTVHSCTHTSRYTYTHIYTKKQLDNWLGETKLFISTPYTLYKLIFYIAGGFFIYETNGFDITTILQCLLLIHNNNNYNTNS